MAVRGINVLKETVGEKTFEIFEKRISADLFTKENESKLLDEAANYIEHLPIVTAPFRENGILQTKETAAFIHVYQPNIWAQDHAHKVGKLDRMTIGSTYERAQAAAELKVQTPSVKVALKKAGKTDYDFFETYKIACLIESGYYSRIGDVEMTESQKRKIDIGIMRRALRNPGLMDTVARALDFDKNDPVALFQVSAELDLTGALQEISKSDPYFRRRSKQILEFTDINSRGSINWENPSAGTIGNLFQQELFMRIAKRKGADAWLMKQLEKLFGRK